MENKQKSTIVINGRIFEFPITGVGRFCYEVITEMDKIVEPGEMILAIPHDARNVPALENIKVKTVGKKRGIFWEQVELPKFTKKNNCKCLSMSSSVPLFAHEYVLIHDISLKVNRDRNGSFKDKLKIWWPLLQYRIGIRKSEKLFTVSNFQKEEIEREYNTSRQIAVIYEGWQHMERIRQDDTIIRKYDLGNKDYFFAVSTRAKNKNFKWILEVAKRNPELTFVVSGKLDTKYFSDDTNLDGLKNIITTGYVSDGEMKALMTHARAFLYPSIYEGFGIPPLEALSVGTKAVVGRASCLPEVYGDAVYYIDPYNYDVDFGKLLSSRELNTDTILNKYSWANAASDILSYLD